MNLALEFPLGIQLLSPELTFDEPVILDDRPSYGEPGFDEVAFDMLVRSIGDSAEDVLSRVMPKGKQVLENQNLWVRTASAQCVAAEIYRLDVKASGLLGDTRFHRTVDAAEQTTSGDEILVDYTGGDFTYPNGAIQMQGVEAALTATTEYVTTVAPEFLNVSESVPGGNVPIPGYPTLPTGPSNKWVSIPDPIYIVPSGWVLTARRVAAILDDQKNEVCWHVRDTHTYYHPVRPGGNPSPEI